MNKTILIVVVLVACAFASVAAINAPSRIATTTIATLMPVENEPHHSPIENLFEVSTRGIPALSDIDTLCQQIDEKLTSVGFHECISSDLKSSGAYSNQHKAIAYRDFKPSTGPALGKVLLIGGIHGDEYSSVTIVFEWLRQLHADQGGQFEWRVVPLLNPDGLLMPPRKSQRMNANGVDLNRNFPTPNWHEEAMDYWVNRTRKSKRRYPGTAPLSEPESRWLSKQIDEFRPDAVISVHAPHGIVDFDGPQVPPDNLGPLELRLLGTYPGSMGRYIGVYKGIPLLTVELESALRMPEEEDAERIWLDTIAWIENHMTKKQQSREKTLLTGASAGGDASISGLAPVETPISERR